MFGRAAFARRAEGAVEAKRRVCGPFPHAGRMCGPFPCAGCMSGPFPRARLLRGKAGVSPAFALTWLAVVDCFDERSEDGSDVIERRDG